MEKFKIEGLDLNGKNIRATVEAINEKEALAKAKQKGIYVTKVVGLGVSDPVVVAPLDPPTPQVEPTPSPPTDHGPFIYKMVQIPPNLSIQTGTAITNQAAFYLEKIVNTYAESGWEFYRVDQVGYEINPGCLGAFLGQSSQYLSYYVVTFRKDAFLVAT